MKFKDIQNAAIFHALPLRMQNVLSTEYRLWIDYPRMYPYSRELLPPDNATLQQWIEWADSDYIIKIPNIGKTTIMQTKQILAALETLPAD